MESVLSSTKLLAIAIAVHRADESSRAPAPSDDDGQNGISATSGKRSSGAKPALGPSPPPSALALKLALALAAAPPPFGSLGVCGDVMRRPMDAATAAVASRARSFSRRHWSRSHISRALIALRKGKDRSQYSV